MMPERLNRSFALLAMLALAACTEPTAPSLGSSLGGWTYRFIVSTSVAGSEVKCYETGTVGFVREPSNDVGGFSGVVSTTCIPVGVLTLRTGRVPVVGAAVSATSLSYRAEACAFTASTPSPPSGGPATTGAGLAECRYEVKATGDSVTAAGTFTLARE
jgi:hypothetical protein